MKTLILIAFIFLSTSVQSSCVILLHGLARSPSSMEALGEELEKHAYSVVNLGYPSREFDIESLAEKAIKPALKQCGDQEINFVTHSLGGILVRQYLSMHTIDRLHHVVMLGPPNQGSEVVDKLKDVPGFHYINGDAGLQLGTANVAIPRKLGAANFDVGIIAGTQSVNLILSTLIPGQDDGKVSIESTKLAGMNDHIEMPSTHPFMMKNKHVIAQVVHYLKFGQFKRNEPVE